MSIEHKQARHTAPQLALRAAATALALALSFAATPIVASAQSSDEIIVNRVVARVNQALITQQQIAKLLPIYLQVMGPFDAAQTGTAEGRAQIAENLIDFLIDTQLLEEKGSELGMLLSSSDVDSYLENYRAQLNLSEPEFRRALSGEGVDYDDYRGFMRLYLIRMQMLRAEVGSDASVTASEVEEEFRSRYPDGLSETFITTSHIFIKLDRGTAASRYDEAITELAAVRADILAGDRAFGEAALRYNEDSTAGRGGRLPALAVTDLDPDYTRAALALNVGEISDPVITGFGVHLVRLEEREERTRDDEDVVRQRIEYELQQTRSRRQEELYLDRLRNNAFVEVLVDDFSL